MKTNLENLESQKNNPDSTIQLEKEILADSKEDIGFTTKLKLLNQKIFELQNKITGVKLKEKELIQKEINSIYREKNRIIRFHKLGKESIKGVDGLEKEDIDKIDAKKLLKIGNEKKNFLSSTFAYKEIKDKNGDIIEESLSNPENINEGDTIIIDFGRNEGAFRKIGAGDILPAKIQVIKITDEKGNTRIGNRVISGSKVGYYDDKGYIPVFNNYKLYIPTSNELKLAEYKNTGIKSSILTDKKQLDEIELNEKAAKINYIQVIEENEKLSRISDIVVEIGNDLNFKGSYKEKLKAIIKKAEEYKNEKQKYSEEEMQLVINRLTRTLDIIGNKEFNFDWDKYKSSIAISESGGMYNNRNDGLGKLRGIEPGKWAFGKYQFIGNTLKRFGINLGNPPEEEKVQAWLQNPALQEEVMDKYMLEMLEKHILSNPNIMNNIEKGENKIEYYLALSHIGGPGALADEDGTDWMKTPVKRYAKEVANRC